MYNIKVYQDENGNSEITDYLHKLKKGYNNSKNDRIKYNKIIAYIRLLSERGITLGEPYIKHLQNDIWELRPIRDRILFAYKRNNIFILLTVFVKDTQKTPIKEIERAKRNLEDYIKRSDNREE